jgi:hypothetical protein
VCRPPCFSPTYGARPLSSFLSSYPSLSPAQKRRHHPSSLTLHDEHCSRAPLPCLSRADLRQASQRPPMTGRSPLPCCLSVRRQSATSPLFCCSRHEEQHSKPARPPLSLRLWRLCAHLWPAVGDGTGHTPFPSTVAFFLRLAHLPVLPVWRPQARAATCSLPADGWSYCGLWAAHPCVQGRAISRAAARSRPVLGPSTLPGGLARHDTTRQEVVQSQPDTKFTGPCWARARAGSGGPNGHL